MESRAMCIFKILAKFVELYANNDDTIWAEHIVMNWIERLPKAQQLMNKSIFLSLSIILSDAYHQNSFFPQNSPKIGSTYKLLANLHLFIFESVYSIQFIFDKFFVCILYSNIS